MKTFFLLSIIPCICLGLYLKDRIKVEAIQAPIISDSSPMVLLDKVPETLQLLNKKNVEIKNFSCDVKAAIDRGNGPSIIKPHGSLKYEKSLWFSLDLWLLGGKQFIAGSNPKYFWYWSAHSDNRSLCYAEHKDYEKTLLKSMFNPIWLIHSLGLSELPEKGKFFDRGCKLVVVYPEKDTLGRDILKIVFIDKEHIRVKGMMVLDAGGQKLAGCEILEYQGSLNLPKKILYDWTEEGAKMIFDFDNLQINSPSLGWRFMLPEIEPKVNMGLPPEPLRPRRRENFFLPGPYIPY